jgi:hypothetical protein
VFSQGFSNSTMESKRALVFWKLKHHCTNTLYYKISQNSTMVENIAPWYHGAIWALRENCISYVHALICLSGLTLELLCSEPESLVPMYSMHIYWFIYSDSLIFGKMYDKETFYSAEYIYFHFICKFYL